jgi:hypothetical protein
MSIEYNNDNTIIFSIARMNPPTPGHMFLIETLHRPKRKIRQNAETKRSYDLYIL